MSIDRIYITAHHQEPGQQTTNEDIAELLESYNFDVWLPQERCRNVQIPVGNGFQHCVEPLEHAKMLIAIFHDPAPDTQMGFELDYAMDRSVPVIGLTAGEFDSLKYDRADQFLKTIVIPNDPDDILHPLMTAINRYFPV